MLFQRFRRDLPGLDAFFERWILKHESFSVAILRSQGLAIDVGAIQNAVTYLTLFRRAQLSLVLSGRGYFKSRERWVNLSAGDAVESDQLQQEPEGYFGSPSEILIVEWDDDSPFGRGLRGDARFSRLGSADVARLRSWIAHVRVVAADTWVVELCRQLRAIGFPIVANLRASDIESAPEPLVRTYDALGEALSRLHAHPSLEDVAGRLSLSERQTNRRLNELVARYRHPFSSWRTFLHENRVEWAIQLLSIPGIPLNRVAALAGYRSRVALNHAFSSRGIDTPAAIAKSLRQRWA